jgi:TPR repeat protein
MNTADFRTGALSVTPKRIRDENGSGAVMENPTHTCTTLRKDLCAGDTFFKLGLMEATGPQTDLVSAHKWFNLAALKGNKDAARWRVEIALEMSKGEIAAAQRAARDWLTRH